MKAKTKVGLDRADGAICVFETLIKYYTDKYDTRESPDPIVSVVDIIEELKARLVKIKDLKIKLLEDK